MWCKNTKRIVYPEFESYSTPILHGTWFSVPEPSEKLSQSSSAQITNKNMDAEELEALE